MLKVIFKKNYYRTPEKTVTEETAFEDYINKIIKVEDNSEIPFPKLEHTLKTNGRGENRIKSSNVVVDDFNLNIVINNKYLKKSSVYIHKELYEYFSDKAESFNLYIYDKEAKEYYVNFYKVYLKEDITFKQRTDDIIQFTLNLGVVGFYPYLNGTYSSFITFTKTGDFTTDVITELKSRQNQNEKFAEKFLIANKYYIKSEVSKTYSPSIIISNNTEKYTGASGELLNLRQYQKPYTTPRVHLYGGTGLLSDASIEGNKSITWIGNTYYWNYSDLINQYPIAFINKDLSFVELMGLKNARVYNNSKLRVIGADTVYVELRECIYL